MPMYLRRRMLKDLATKSLPLWSRSELDNPFKPPTKVIVVHDSIRYHKVTAIETQAREYRHIYDIFMSDETRKRLNLN